MNIEITQLEESTQLEYGQDFTCVPCSSRTHSKGP